MFVSLWRDDLLSKILINQIILLPNQIISKQVTDEIHFQNLYLRNKARCNIKQIFIFS